MQLEALHHLASSLAIFSGETPEHFEVSQFCEGPSKNVFLQSGEAAYPLRLIMNLVSTNSFQRVIGADMDQLSLSVQ